MIKQCDRETLHNKEIWYAEHWKNKIKEVTVLLHRVNKQILIILRLW